MTDSRTCPDEGELYELASGTIAKARGTALREHIGDCDACRTIVASLASSARASEPTPGGHPEAERYELQRLLGSGGMGEVFLAQDRVLGRPVALKLLREDGAADTGALERVTREARALASLADPNVVAVYDRGVLDGRPFLAMEYVRGLTLRQWVSVANEKPDLDRIVATLVQAGRGLSAAHAIGVVHRDFKPDNVLVGEDGRARVTDFGLARTLPRAAESAPGLNPATRPRDPAATDGLFAGTLAYAAPERLAGSAADARSDQYAFCVTAYEALHGFRPADAPPRMSGTPSGDSRLPALDVVLARGLSPRPVDRFTTMTDLLQALENALHPRPDRRRWFVLSVVLLAGAALGALVLVRHTAARGVALPEGLHAQCGGAAGSCEAPLLCKYPEGNFCGVSGAPGTCGWPIDGCDANAPPVCGCNGTTYATQCKAHLEAQPTAYRGACVECSAAAPCLDVSANGKRTPTYCRVATDSLGTTHGGASHGVCLPRPATCPSGGAVACGWDGRTYESGCEARRAGTDVAHDGPCPEEASGVLQSPDGTSTPPLAPGGLALGAPDEQGMDARPLIALSQWIAREKLPILSLLVSRNGVLVYELYTSSATREKAHYLTGVTVALTSALVGIAMDRHLVGPPETSVADAFPASVFPSLAARERFRGVTIRDVLGMSALDAPVPPLDRSDAAHDRLQRFHASRNHTKFALAEKIVPQPGVSYQNTEVTAQIATGILEYATGQSALELAEAWLFEPMGFANYEWLYQDADGIDSGATGLRLRPIDMHKLGVLYLRRGAWEEKPLVSSEWVARSFSPFIRTNDRVVEPNYGWYWRTIDYAPSIPAGTRLAGSWTGHVVQGARGQRIAVFVDAGVVVTMTAVIDPPEDEVDIFRRIVADYVVPSVAGTGATPPHPNPSLRADLATALDALRTTSPVPAAAFDARMVPSIEPKGTHHTFRAGAVDGGALVAPK
jgi:CubicO group peptidase (beta-lactamase class C family)/aminoglycoside phosphotransferase (APT) family kinase protein